MSLNTNCKLFLCFLCLFFCVNSSFDRQQQSDPEYLRSYRKAESLYNRQSPSETDDSLALAQYIKTIRLHEGARDALLWNSFFRAGILYQTSGDFANAIPYLKNALAVSAEAHIADSLLYLPNLYLGNSYYSVSLLDSAVYHYRIAEQFVVKYPTLEGRERLYNTLGAVNYEAGDYAQSIRYFEKALQVLMLEQPHNTTLLVNYKNNIAASFRQLKQYDKALEMFRDLLKYGSNRNELLHNIGSVYLEKNRPAEAIAWLKKVRYESQMKYNDLSLSYFQMKMYDSSKLYLNKALELNSRNGGRKNIHHAQSLRYLGDLFLLEGKIDSALQQYQRSIIQLVSDYNIVDPQKSPVSFDGQYFVVELFESLLQKAKAFRQRFAASNDQADLIACTDTYKSLYNLVDHVSRNYESEEARFFLQDKKHLTHNEPIDVALQLYRLTNNRRYVEEAFEFDERNKAVILALQVQQHEARLRSSIPPDLLQKETTIKREIQQLNLGQEESSANLDRLRDLQIQLAQLQKRFDEIPAYKQARNVNTIVTVPQLHRLIPKNAGVLSYHVGDSTLVTFFITKDSFSFATSVIDREFIESIHPLYISLQNRFQYNKSVAEKAMMEIYNHVLLPFEKRIVGCEQLMIIPDDELVWVPFQALSNAKGEILIEKHSIIYNYSCSILNELSALPSTSNNRILAMAPFTEKGPLSLPGTTSEIARISGRKAVASAATKQLFLDSAGAYNIIHLATHAYVNDSVPNNSYIRFYPGKGDSAGQNNLYASEIMDASLQATHLVILSACETGSGQLIRGEGLMSLTRAFTYAGCPQVIASLWKADDFSTADIAGGLHTYIAEGLGPAHALQKATLDYVDNDKISRSQKIPAYWAHLRLIGTFDGAVSSNSEMIILVVALVSFVVCLVIYFSRKAPSA